MAVYSGDSNNISRNVASIYVGDVNNKARKVLKMYVGDASNKAQLVFEDKRDFTNLNFKLTEFNEATGGDLTLNKIYTAIPKMWNTKPALNSSVSFVSTKLRLRSNDVIKCVYDVSVPADCKEYDVSIWLLSNGTNIAHKSLNSKEKSWEIKSSLRDISFRINLYGDKSGVTLNSCAIYINDTQIL